MVWKFCGKAQFPHGFGRIAVFYAVTVTNTTADRFSVIMYLNAVRIREYLSGKTKIYLFDLIAR